MIKPINGADKNRIMSKIKKLPLNRFDARIGFEVLLNEKKPNLYNYDDITYFLATKALEYLSGEYSKDTFPKLIYIITSLIDYHFIDENNQEELDTELYLKLKELKPAFDEFKKSNNPKYLKTDEIVRTQTEETIELIHKKIDQLFTSVMNSEDTEVTDEVSKATDKETPNNVAILQQMQDKINELKAKVEEYEKTITSLEKKNAALTRSESKEKSDLHKLKEELSNLKIQYQNLLKQKEKLEKQVAEIDSLNEQITHLNEQLQNLQDKYNSLELQHQESNAQLQVYQQIESDNDEKEKIRHIIFELILTKNLSFYEILDELNSNGFNITMNELYAHLKELKLIIQLDETLDKNGYPAYKVNRTKATSGTLSFNCTNESESNFIFISNSLLTDVNSDYLHVMDKIYEYCIKYNISEIFNLGDVFNKLDKYSNYGYLSNLQRLIESLALKHPHDRNINNYFLGGNIDANGLSIGFNTIEQLCACRPDFMSLGYSNSIINLNSTDAIRIHVPLNKPDASIIKEIESQKKNPYFITLYGSEHETVIDFEHKYMTVPPLISDSLLSGATHVKVIYNADKNIAEIILIPIIIKEKILPTSYIHVRK